MTNNTSIVCRISRWVVGFLVAVVVLEDFENRVAKVGDDMRQMTYASSVSDQDRGEAESIVSGQFRAVGKRGGAENAGDTLESSDSVLFCTFNFAKHHVRFDREETALNSVEQAAANGERELVIGRHVIFNDRRLDWSSFIPHEIRVTGSDKKMGSVAQPFDIRTIGTAGIYSICENISLAEVLATIGKLEIVSVSRTNQGIRVIEWNRSSGPNAPA